MKNLLKMLPEMQSSKLGNYIIAGLDSYLLENGKVRVFRNSRVHQDQITPHSHRYDFACLVLKGRVTNRLWHTCHKTNGDFFEESLLTYEDSPGNHIKTAEGRDFYTFIDKEYTVGETYCMEAGQLHSITFSKGAVVLFFEGPTTTDKSYIIEPVVNGAVIPTYVKQDYMFLEE